ncbi:hypothetical protein NECAME_06135 [Necator americanus]|uniref:Uncharacterized protein n=1 Tax=Necator americanus TaxID=51031 RepID=W2TV43_NECAM|nr:hypothetical protein NECAME_06135 [Necator americanus]ETN85970.1 hypothetical protein NECAME_06135 [Necator americanus]
MKTHLTCLLLLFFSTLLYTANAELDRPTNDAPRDDSDVWLVVVLCALICFAMRHANDFYAGETITLVEEGVWSGRFRHKVEHRVLTSIEKDFNDMYEQLKDKEEERIQAQNSNKP